MKARLWIMLILWPDQSQIKGLADFDSIVMCLSCKLWVCFNTIFLSQTVKVTMGRNEPDWSYRSTCSLLHSRYSWNQFYLPLLKKKKKSIQSYVRWMYTEREIWYSSISWVSPWLNEKALLDEAVKLNTPFINRNANMESNCYSRQLCLTVMFDMGVVVQQKIVAFFFFFSN